MKNTFKYLTSAFINTIQKSFPSNSSSLRSFIWVIFLMIGSMSHAFGQTTCLQDGISFSTQAEIDNFATTHPGCTEIGGDVFISQAITNLTGLSDITKIDGDLIISHTQLTSLNGLNQLIRVEGDLYISYNNSLNSLNGLNYLSDIKEELKVDNNPEITDLSGLTSLNTVRRVSITRNTKLTSLQGMDQLTQIGGLYIWSNPLLQNLKGLEKITSITGHLNIIGNTALKDLCGLYQLRSVGGSLGISQNPSLGNLNGLQALTVIGSSLGVFSNKKLGSLNGLSSLTSIGIGITIGSNNSLGNLNALSSVTSIGSASKEGYAFDYGISITNNSNLSSIVGLRNIEFTPPPDQRPRPDAVLRMKPLKITIKFNRSLSNCELPLICNLIKTRQPQNGNYPLITVIHNKLQSDCLDIKDVVNACTECSDNLPQIWFEDYDKDGFGNPQKFYFSCSQASNYVTNSQDCYDRDDGRNLKTLWYADFDNDNYGDPAISVSSCYAPCNFVSNNTDHLPDNPNAYPGAPEIPGNGIDENGNGMADDGTITTVTTEFVFPTDDLQAKINSAASSPNPVELWLVQGTHLPSKATPADPTKSFELANNVSLYGGFIGTETRCSERDPVAHPTILSGALAGGVQSYHVIKGANLDETAILDGLIIEKGKANGTTIPGDQQGGGIYLTSSSSPIIRNCIIRDNFAKQNGGGLWCEESSPTLINCAIYGNQAQQKRGGGLFSTHAVGITPTGSAPLNFAPILVNCTVTQNRCGNGGGGRGIHIVEGRMELTNTIVYGNTNNSGAMPTTIENLEVVEAAFPTSYTITGSRITFTNCLVNGPLGNGVDANLDPLFVNPASPNFDFQLQATSPAKDTGVDAANNTDKDLAGNPRKTGVIDLGAYEKQ